jgi:hypothetical protein
VGKGFGPAWGIEMAPDTGLIMFSAGTKVLTVNIIVSTTLQNHDYSEAKEKGLKHEVLKPYRFEHFLVGVIGLEPMTFRV